MVGRSRFVRATTRMADVLLSVADTGCGMTTETMDQLFEPLFTTKPKGIGLGLALCKLHVEANGGTIKAASTEGVGTTFTITLPVADVP